MSEIHPTGIQVDRAARVVTIHWSDGLSAAYGFDGLRAACPCVECKGGHANMGTLPPDNIFAAPEAGGPATTDRVITGIELIGSYAVQITWSDGHSYGIYTWDYLITLRDFLRRVNPAAVFTSS